MQGVKTQAKPLFRVKALSTRARASLPASFWSTWPMAHLRSIATTFRKTSRREGGGGLAADMFCLLSDRGGLVMMIPLIVFIR